MNVKAGGWCANEADCFVFSGVLSIVGAALTQQHGEYSIALLTTKV